LNSIERCVGIMQGLQEGWGLEQMVILLVRSNVEATAVHVVQDGTAWSGVVRDSDALADLSDLALGVATNDEIETSEIAEEFDPATAKRTPEIAMSGILWSMAESTGSQVAILLGRYVGEEPAWLAARYELGRVYYMESPPDTFDRELVRLHEITSEAVDSSMPKPSLRAAEVASSSTLDPPPQLLEVFEEQRQAFRRKFGRDPGPEDPIFFDPDSDTPQPVPPEKIRDFEAVLAEHGFNEEEYLKGLAELEDGGHLQRGARKVGRNDPCSCGSGKKYKHCHGT